MIGHRASYGEPIFNDIEPVHRVLGRFHPTPLRERTRADEIALAAIEKIAVERENDVGAVKSRNQSDVFAEASPRCVILRFAQRGVVDAPHHFWKRFLQIDAQSLTRGRVHFFDQESQSLSAADLSA